MKSIRPLIQEAINASNDPTRGDVPSRVLADIPVGELRDYLLDAVRVIVPSMNANQRGSLNAAIAKAVEANGASGPRVQIEVDPLTLEERSVVHPQHSAKQQKIRDEWQNFLATNTIPSVNGGHVFLKDATAADLRACADYRRIQSEGLLREANAFERAAHAVELRGAGATLGAIEAAEAQGLRAILAA